MLSLRTGSFRSLEDELVATLRCRPSLEPATVIVPSGMIRRRLQRACAIAGGVMNVRFPDFRSLALGLLDEAGVPVRPAVEDRGEDEVFRAFLREPGAPECYRVLADRPGASLLLATVRDLRAAVVSPGLMKDVKEELPEDARRLAELARLVELYDAFLERFGLTTRAAVSGQARRCAAASKTVRGTPTWAVYGFLEFNGEEKDLFDEIARAVDVTVYVPWRDARAWAHVDRTLNDDFGMARGRRGEVVSAPGDSVDLRTLRTKPPKARGEAGPVTSTHRPTAFTRRLFDPAESPHAGDTPIPVVSASGSADELWYAVKEARRVHESEGVAWRDIGILCRSVDRRLGHADRMFREECVPWTTSARRPLAERPLAQTAALATRIVTDDRHHLDVMEWLGSPFLREEHRPDEWRIILESLGIVSGSDWERLAGARGTDLAPPGERPIPMTTVNAFAEAADALFRTLPDSPARGWADLARAWEGFLEARLHTERDEPAWEAIRDILDALRGFEGGAAAPGPGRFARVFQRGLASREIPAHPSQADGVALLDAAAARGQRFRVAILIGLNDREWPAPPREDPFLPDATRRRIAETTGCRLREKMDRVAEERLYFALALDSAERVVLLHRRVDDGGRREAPSPFLDEVRRVVHVEDKPGVPRMTARKFDRKLGWLTWNEQRLHALVTGTPDEDVTVRKAFETSRGWDAWLTWDLASAPPAAHIASVRERGISPSALQDLATCPFRYWARRICRLEPLDPLESEEDLAVREVGQVLHEALADRARPDTVDVAREIFRERSRLRPPLRWAVWQAAQDAGLRALGTLVAADRAELAAGGWRVAESELALGPVAFAGALPPLSGRLDRLEVRDSEKGPEFRVTDFKYRGGRQAPGGTSSEESVERAALSDAVRGVRVQLPLYAALAQAHLGAAPAFAGAHYFYFGPRFAPVRRGLCLSAGRAELEGSLARGWEALLNGWFVPVDDADECRRCDIRAICRRGHFPTRTRSLNDPRFRRYIEGRFA